ncbi:hypothetical protein SUZIE_104125 [Sciurus carolinensis]|uniref:Uncharacterized protein n=1 Tax=Sciurus carolinensis TaxID=30640 RepID=A0AA41MD65_SCICA|nr:hypothetical protein [Sciurus carolinensis]
MEFCAAQRAILQLLGSVAPADRPALLQWMRTTRKRPEADAGNGGKDMLRALTFGDLAEIQQQPKPTVHVDAFLYDEDFIDSLCEEGKMSRNYCMGYLYSSAVQLYGVELNGDFCQLQEMVIKKYQFNDRIKVLHADICTQGSLLQNADVVIMNNVFEYFLNEVEQAR